MKIKPLLKSLARRTGRLPGVSELLRVPVVRRTLAKLPGVGHAFSDAAGISAWVRLHPFDIAHGTDTSGFVAVADLDQLEHEAVRDQSLPYASSQPSIIRAALAALPQVASFAFLDLGCGKGRPLLVASEFPFREIIGVEQSASLAATARRNADLIRQRFSGRPPIRVVVADAGRFSLPAGNLVLFLYNPFDEKVMAKVAEAVETALTRAQRTIYVVYYNPVAGHCFDALPLLRRHFAGTLPYADDELGYGPDTEDPIVVWQGGSALAPTAAGANARIEIVDPRHRVKLAPA